MYKIIKHYCQERYDYDILYIMVEVNGFVVDNSECKYCKTIQYLSQDAEEAFQDMVATALKIV